jgi:uncharacterized DUF497 family protein
MQFEWDAVKDRRNQLKHRVSFETATLVFADPHALNLVDRIEADEERWHTIGLAGGILLVLVAYVSRYRRRRTNPDLLRQKGYAEGKAAI